MTEPIKPTWNLVIRVTTPECPYLRKTFMLRETEPLGICLAPKAHGQNRNIKTACSYENCPNK